MLNQVTAMGARGIMSIIFIALVGAQGYVSSINEPLSLVWEALQADNEVSRDVERLTSECDLENFLFIINDYAAKRTKGVKTPSQYVTSVAELLLQLPTLNVTLSNLLYTQMLEVAVALNSTFVTTVPDNENVPMRGWPMKIKSEFPEMDSYQGGHIGEAVGLAAEQAALHGDHETAASLAHSVAAMLHDGFLTADLKRTKMVTPGVVVYVPAGAPKGRHERYAASHKSNKCLDKPQALNHGLMAGMAAIALLRACNAIDWSQANWHLKDAGGILLDMTAYLKDLEEFVLGSARVLLDSLSVRRTTSSSRDLYPGPKGTEWYKWKYWDVSECPEKVGGIEDRWEDITHARYEIKFAAKVSALGGEYFGTKEYFGVKKKDFRRFLVTALNRLIVDLTVSGGARFACDVSGNTTNKKSCRASREVHVRQKQAEYLLIAAIAARDDPKAKCDVISLVSSVLPLFVKGDPDFSTTSETECMSMVLIQAKYYFYKYRADQDVCPTHVLETPEYVSNSSYVQGSESNTKASSKGNISTSFVSTSFVSVALLFAAGSIIALFIRKRMRGKGDFRAGLSWLKFE